MENCNKLPSKNQGKPSSSTAPQSAPPVSKTSSESHSNFITDDRSNSASPVRRQPNPAGLRSPRYLEHDDGRYLQWPPPEPRTQNLRTLLPPIGMFFGGPARLLPDRNIFLFGPPTQIQRLMSENILRMESSDIEEAPVERDVVTRRATTEGTPARDLEINGQSFPIFDASEIANAQAELSEELGDNMEEFHAQENAVESDDMHDAINGERTNTEPPTGPIVFVIVDTNDGGPEEDEQVAQQFQLALMHLLAQFDINSGEESEQTDGLD